MSQGEHETQLCVLGAGYVGLVTAACLSTLGFNVCCIDRDEQRVEGLRHGIVPIYEPGLDDAIAAGMAARRLRFSTKLGDARGAAAIFMAVGTLDERGEWTATAVETALREICADGSAPRTIVVRSTLMPGATARLQVLAHEIDPTVEIALNPEFTRQGSAMNDFMNPDRVVIGLTRPERESNAVHVLRRAYAAIEAPLVVTDAATAELIKTGANVFLALKIGFANEMARLAAAMDADVATVADGIGLDARIGRSYLSPGPGFGGSCLPSQSRALPEIAENANVATPIIDAIARSNAGQAEWVARQVKRAIGDLAPTRIAVLGLTFKPGTDDVRESPALAVCRALVANGAVITGHDPKGAAAALAVAAQEGWTLNAAESADAAATDADAVVLATDWPEYYALDWAAVRSLMRGCTVIDTRGVVDLEAARAAGLNVLVHGRASTPID